MNGIHPKPRRGFKQLFSQRAGFGTVLVAPASAELDAEHDDGDLAALEVSADTKGLIAGDHPFNVMVPGGSKGRGLYSKGVVAAKIGGEVFFRIGLGGAAFHQTFASDRVSRG